MKNILLIAATGRHYVDLKLLPMKDVRFDYLITLNGQLIFNGEGKLIKGRPFKKECRKEIQEIFDEKRIPIMPVLENGNFINYLDASVESAFRAITTRVPRIGTYNGEDVYQIMAYGDEEMLKEAAGRISHSYSVRWNPFAIDIIPEDGGKEKGIRDMLDYLSLKEDEVIAFGDGNNDIGMLDMIRTSVAMGNAEEAVKQAASYVTTDIDEDGIYNALKHFNII